MNRLNNFGSIDTNTIIKAAKEYKTPFYLYDEMTLIDKCKDVLSMPNAYGLKVRYAMKANSCKSLLNIINKQGIGIDASSLNEAKRASLAGIDLSDVILTTQEVQCGDERSDLENMIKQGMKYNVCSLRQLYLIGDFARSNNVDLSIRVHPGVGTGESASRNTGDEYSCFGIHLSDIEQALEYAQEQGIKFTQVHVHIGSGGAPEIWRQNIDLELSFIEKYFSDALTVSLGGGLKEARMPYEEKADIYELGLYAKQQVEAFYERTGRKLITEIEPGTYIATNTGYIVTKVLDKKSTGDTGFDFIVTDGGMDVNARPLLYGSQHPFYVISQSGRLLSSDYIEETVSGGKEMVVVGRCCESGDSQCLDSYGNIQPRKMAEPEFNDIFVIGGAGAYCSAMTPFNYNSHTQAAEVLCELNGNLRLIRKRQSLEQITENEI